jgi:predicted dehydrogenase
MEQPSMRRKFTSLSRRKFLTNSAATAAAALLVKPSLVHGTQANSAILIGLIGVGDRGSAHLAQIANLAKDRSVQITAICDVWQVNLHRATERVKTAFGHQPRTFTHYGEVLEAKDVDAVVIATPDFAHGPILNAALAAGKDVYVEKPMTIDLAEANRAFDQARDSSRVVQVGTQYRSHGGYTAAARELAAGALGKIHRIHAAANFNQARWARDCSNCKEADVHWAAYLFNRKQRPFDPRLLRRWQLYREFTNGLAGLWMSHYVDAVHLLTGAKYPTSAVALGGTYVWQDGREHTDTFHTILEYPEGFLFDWSMCLGNSAGTGFQVFGTQAMLDIGPDYATPKSLTVSSEGAGPGSHGADYRIQPDRGQDHMSNWLTCLRTRERPNADIQYGHQHTVATIMAAKSWETGQRQKYDPHKREIYSG